MKITFMISVSIKLICTKKWNWLCHTRRTCVSQIGSEKFAELNLKGGNGLC